MAKNHPHAIDLDDLPDPGNARAVAETAAERVRVVLDRVPAVATDALEAFAGAGARLDGLSDLGLIGASGFALGIGGGLWLAGAPRPIVALSMIPVAVCVRAALVRGVRPARLVN